MQIHAQIASKNPIVQNKCFRGSLNLHMAKASNENISALMSITKKDRDSVVRALNQVLEINYLNPCSRIENKTSRKIYALFCLGVFLQCLVD